MPLRYFTQSTASKTSLSDGSTDEISSRGFGLLLLPFLGVLATLASAPLSPASSGGSLRLLAALGAASTIGTCETSRAELSLRDGAHVFATKAEKQYLV
eukprot:6175869-Pleurochrysis_carterae.AAC.10